MKWINHLAIAWATTALVSPALVPVALLGSTAPDWLEWVLEKFGHRVRHRTLTHIMLYWIGALVLWDFHGILAAFAWGDLAQQTDYNRNRLHSTLGYLSPLDFEAQFLTS